ncbi:unnamed protein product [Brassica rapa]|uniref:DUF547 domain-containing protein n=1 Tax=Brassica campestris TaxID=3711 RepID=A0A3P6A3E0_BRACM|nr:unnamed protein product [Brassica rapa]VDC81703.1 unnamed protein product [Brassica rapa]
MKLEDLLGEEETKDQNSVAALLDHHRRLNRQESQQLPAEVKDDYKSEEEKKDLLKKKQKRRLQRDVVKMQGELEDEQALNKALRDMLRGPVMSQPRLSLLLLPPQASSFVHKLCHLNVQELIEELGTVEAEILCLEKRIQDLKLDVHSERKENQELEANLDGEEEEERMMTPKRLLLRQNHLPCNADNAISKMRSDDLKQRYKSYSCENPHLVKDIQNNSLGTHASIGSSMEFSSRSHSSTFYDGTSRTQEKKNVLETTPNGISEDLVKCLMGIYLELNRSSREREGSRTVSKLSLSHLKNASFKRKSVYDQNASNLDPYGVVMGTSFRDIGEYKNFIHITRTSIDVSRLSDCSTSIVNLRVLKEKLSKVDLSFLNHKKKMAFWINTYNACVMNGFLEHGLPSSKEKLLTILKMATIDVGGTQLSALDIEGSILQSPCEPRETVSTGENEARLQKRYGFRCVEPNLMFVLCRGDWSSPALRVYTAEDVVNELIKARTEYLEASISISGRKKIVIPRFLHKRFRDFAEDEGSLVEWICSQLPPVQRCLQVKETAVEWLNKKGESSLNKLVEVRPHEYEFRYLLPL